jgi:hypothetical protein
LSVTKTHEVVIVPPHCVAKPQLLRLYENLLDQVAIVQWASLKVLTLWVEEALLEFLPLVALERQAM